MPCQLHGDVLAIFYQGLNPSSKSLRPYHAEYTGSRPNPAVKQHRARSVLGWETAWEYRVL